MKLLIAMIISVFTTSVFAADLSIEGTLKRVETENNVTCEFAKTSKIQVCFGYPSEYSLCRYTETYECSGTEAFTLKLKVKETGNSYKKTSKRVVTKVVYIE